MYEARRTIELAPTNPWYYFNLGNVYEEVGHWDEALRTYEQASQIDSAEPIFQLAMGGVWLQNNQPSRALPIIERVYTALPDDRPPATTTHRA